MPIYEYQCQTCETQFDKFFRTLSQVTSEITCPACDSDTVARRFNAPVVHSGAVKKAIAAEESLAAAEAEAAKPPVFGRKELKQAAENKRKIKESVAAEKAAANHKPVF